MILDDGKGMGQVPALATELVLGYPASIHGLHRRGPQRLLLEMPTIDSPGCMARIGIECRGSIHGLDRFINQI